MKSKRSGGHPQLTGLPAVGEVVAVTFRRCPTADEDSALNPGLFVGRVLKHSHVDTFVAKLMNHQFYGEETHIRWHPGSPTWTDQSFFQPIASVRFPVSEDLKNLLKEVEALPVSMNSAGTHRQPELESLRLEFLFRGFEEHWFEEMDSAMVHVSDIVGTSPEAMDWGWKELGEYRMAQDRIVFDWPVEGRTPSDWVVNLTKQGDGTYRCRSATFDDELRCRLERRSSCDLLLGFWTGRSFKRFFGVVLPASGSGIFSK